MTKPINFLSLYPFGWIFLFFFLLPASVSAQERVEETSAAGSIYISERADTISNTILADDGSIVYCTGAYENPIEFVISHRLDHDLSCDPDLSTPAGIRYLIFTKQPADLHVRDLSMLKPLPLLEKDGEVIVLGSGTVDDLVILEKDVERFGLERPFEIWIVPFVSHNTESTNFAGHFEAKDRCLDFNLEAAVSVLALKRIDFLFYTIQKHSGLGSEISYNEIWGRGGLPELYPDQGYRVTAVDNLTGDSITIVRTENGKDRFKLNTPMVNTEFSVVDQSGCNYAGWDNFQFIQPKIKLSGQHDFANQGEKRCIPFFADQVFDLEQIRMRLSWDPATLRLTDVTGLHPVLAGDNVHVDRTGSEDGILIFDWENGTVGDFKLAPGATLFELCFTVLADPGTVAEISVDDEGTLFDNGRFFQEWESTSGSITVPEESESVLRYYTYCHTSRDSAEAILYFLERDSSITIELSGIGIYTSESPHETITLTDIPAGTYSYRFISAAGEKSEWVGDEIEIPSGNPAKIELEGSFAPDCESDRGWIKLLASPDQYEYLRVYGPEGNQNYSPKLFFDDLIPGEYTFVGFDAAGCRSRPLTVDLSGKNMLRIEADQTSATCGTDSPEVTFRVTDQDGALATVLLWVDGDQMFPSNTAVKVPPGTYSVEIRDPEYCHTEKQILISGSPPPVLPFRLSASDSKVESGEVFTVFAEYDYPANVVSYRWHPGESLLSGREEEATFRLDSSSVISYTIIDDHGCEYGESLWVEVEESSVSAEELHIPNAFTPNGDGSNEVLKFYTQHERLVAEKVYIYDRYGNIIFSDKNISRKGVLWDGRTRHQSAPPGIYVVQILFRTEDGSAFYVTRSVLLLQ